MLVSLPIELYCYMDCSGDRPVIIASAPESIKEKARKVDETIMKKFGKKFFAEIKDDDKNK